MEKIYIVTPEYSDNLAKKQPWYSIKKLKNDLNKLNFDVSIISYLNQVPKDFNGRVIKLFGFKDLIRFGNMNYKLIFLFTSPIMPFSKLYSIGTKTILKNWKYLYKIFALSMLPRWIIIRTFKKANTILVVSDTLEKYFDDVKNLFKYIPFAQNNWGLDIELPLKNKYENKKKTLGFFGPPYLTRHFDSVVDFFIWTEKKSNNYNSKLITRIDEDSLARIQKKYLNKLSIDNTKIVSGFLSRKKLLEELSQIDVMILPFRVVMEELPIVVMESLELGIPVVTTNDCGIAEITKGRKDILILDNFSKNNFKRALNFIENYKSENFDEVLNNIRKINNIALGKICK